MSRREALLPRTWEAWRELMLTIDALFMGVIYTFGPERLQSAGAFTEADYYLAWVGGMRFVGSVCFTLSIILIVNRFLTRVPYYSRVAFAMGAAIYFIYAILILAALIAGTSDAGAGWVHLFVISWLFFRASAESPMLPVENRYTR